MERKEPCLTLMSQYTKRRYAKVHCPHVQSDSAFIKNKRHLRGDAPLQMALNLSYNQSQITDSMSSVFVLPSSVNVTHMPVSKKSVGIYGSSSTSVIDCFNGIST